MIMLVASIVRNGLIKGKLFMQTAGQNGFFSYNDGRNSQGGAQFPTGGKSATALKPTSACIVCRV